MKLFRLLGLFLSFFSVFFITGAKGLELPEAIKKQLHSESEYKIKVIKNGNVSDIMGLSADPSAVKIAVIQMEPERMTEDLASTLNEWVEKDGGSLWFYDSRLAHFFGMTESSVNPQGNLSKNIAGEYGDTKKFPGRAVVAYAVGKHPLVTGITGATVFLLNVGNDAYSAVKAQGDVKALLALDPSSDVAVSAIREIGKGKILFKPLLWPNQVDGGRFQVNCLEYSAGFPVPHIIETSGSVSDSMLIPGKEASKWTSVDIMELKDGRVIPGKFKTNEIKFESPKNTIKCSPALIKEIRIGNTMGTDIVVTVDGKEYKGMLFAGFGGFDFTVPSGKTMKFKREDIVKILFHIDRENINNDHIDTQKNSRGTR